jgi:hypothetical protein
MGDEFLDPQPPLIPVRRFSQYLSECMHMTIRCSYSGIDRQKVGSLQLNITRVFSSLLQNLWPAFMAVLQIANGKGGAEASPAGTSYGDAVNLVDEPDLPETSPLANQRICPFRIMRIDSYPAIVFSTSHGTKPKAGGDSLLNETMVLLQDIIHVRRRPAAAAPSQLP